MVSKVEQVDKNKDHTNNKRRSATTQEHDYLNSYERGVFDMWRLTISRWVGFAMLVQIVTQ